MHFWFLHLALLATWEIAGWTLALSSNIRELSKGGFLQFIKISNLDWSMTLFGIYTILPHFMIFFWICYFLFFAWMYLNFTFWLKNVSPLLSDWKMFIQMWNQECNQFVKYLISNPFFNIVKERKRDGSYLFIKKTSISFL